MHYLNNKKLTEIQRSINETDQSPFRPLRITVLRNIMIENEKPYLTYLLNKIQLRPEFTFGHYDTIIQDIENPDIVNGKTEVILIHTFTDNLTTLFSQFYRYNQTSIEQEVNRIKTYIETILSQIRKKTEALIFWNSLEKSPYNALGIAGTGINGSTSQDQLLDELNAYLSQRINETPGAYFVDINSSLIKTGTDHFYDLKYWFIGKTPYTSEALKRIATASFRYLQAIHGKNKKCIVVDCDNTLWGGIIGEDGPEGISIGPVHPGNTYLAFQNELLNLYHRGILLAICSKNNEEDVYSVFKENPGMLLKQEHFAATRINWDNKAENLRQIASELNIGLDSFVFIDDNPYETEWIRTALPEVETILLEKDRPHTYAEILKDSELFDTLAITGEDKVRGKFYSEEKKRKESATSYADLNSYLRSLEMTLHIGICTQKEAERVASLTQKTNQFNLTTTRHTRDEVNKMLDDPDRLVFYISVYDKFGDMGITGIAMLKNVNNKNGAEIENLLLSCRVIGRGVENVFLNHILLYLKSKGVEQIKGRFIPTHKNKPASLFYQQNGFEEIASIDNTKEFHKIIDVEMPINNGVFKEVLSEYE